jgi:ABC-type uncharacterized transport system ATPase subunit
MSETILGKEQASSGPTARKRSRSNSPNPPDREVNHPAIRFIDMTKSFGSFTAVDNLNLNINKDEIFCFLGHNGAGKTTSLNVLIGKL